MRVLSLLYMVIILYSCSDKYRKNEIEQKAISQQTETKKKISIQRVGELRFRMGYVIEGKTLNPSQLKKIGQDKRTYYYAGKPDTALLKKFQDLDLVNYDELLLRKFNSCQVYDYDNRKALFTLTDSLQTKVSVELCYKGGYNQFNLCVADDQQTSEIEIDGWYVEGLKYMLLDIIKGGYKEVVILNNYYIMNGDNSDVFIYEINYN